MAEVGQDYLVICKSASDHIQVYSTSYGSLVCYVYVLSWYCLFCELGRAERRSIAIGQRGHAS